MEQTLLIIKPGAVQRELAGEIISRFERRGLQICGLKMLQLTEDVLDEHYAHLAQLPFFPRIKSSMMACPVIVCCLAGVDAVRVVRDMAGKTNARDAAAGTVRGDFSVSIQENVVHTSDSPENASVELARFFKPEEIFLYRQNNHDFIYAENEI
ncbi:MAG: nucleoside-diphosphate kinase [Paludibacter sp.]|jgi:nucleoside-diphosphate kinase|nr:nucleoside-diphosphate kinase [Paludibacter sp.]